MIINFMIIDLIKLIELVFLMNKFKIFTNESFHLPWLTNWTSGIMNKRIAKHDNKFFNYRLDD
jgi:hypothetical protein